MSRRTYTAVTEVILEPAMAENKANSSLTHLAQVARDLYEGLEKVNLETLSEEGKSVLKATRVQAREMFFQMEGFIAGVLENLEETEENLKQSSKRLLGQVAEQLDKVTESTQLAVHSVLNRIDKICERQNKVFEQINEIKSKLDSVDKIPACEGFLKRIQKLEELENEIQLETFEIMNEMQFQDITSQQLQLANQLTEEAKLKLLDFRNILALLTGEFREARSQADVESVSFDPGATMKDREKRQSLADQVTKEFDKSKKP